MTDITQNKINILIDKFDLKRGKIDLSLERITEFLKRLGNPHLNMPPVIHVAGTNGKGSTIAFLKAMIEADGKTCHAYTSPHLVRFNERIYLAGKDIDNARLLKVLEYVDAEYEKHKHEFELTFFELTTVAAFVAFSQNKADFVLLETGMGGRLDATNLAPKPKLTIITPISFDHMAFLGDTIASIAREKAGIMKEDVNCISAPQVKEAADVLDRIADEVGSDLIFVQTIKDLPGLGLRGEHQKTNATVAIAAALEIGIGKKGIEKGLQSAKWPARMQRIHHGKLPKLLPQGFELWLDGAHNLAGAEALGKEIGKHKKPVYLVMGMLNTKDAASYLAFLKGKVKMVFTIPVANDPKSFSPKELAEIATNAGLQTQPVSDVFEALKQITEKEKSPASIFICGSLYLAGHILEQNHE